MKKLMIVLVIIDICAALCFALFYGPYNVFREYLITTAMETMTHKYLARTFYSEEIINQVLQSNSIEDISINVDNNETNMGNIIENNYNSAYEKEILDHEDNQLFKVIDLEVNNYPAYLVAIYDPSMVKVTSTKYLGVHGQYVSALAKQTNALIAINGGGFIDDGGTGNGGIPTGIVIQDSKIMWGDGSQTAKIIGFNKENKLILRNMTGKEAINSGIRDAMEFGPYLIVDGVAATMKGNGGKGINPRTVIAQRKDGIVLFLIVDGIKTNNWNLRGGASIKDVLEVLQKYGAYNAANLDGGASSVLAVNGEVYNHPCAKTKSGQRNVPNGWIVVNNSNVSS